MIIRPLAPDFDRDEYADLTVRRLFSAAHEAARDAAGGASRHAFLTDTPPALRTAPAAGR